MHWFSRYGLPGAYFVLLSTSLICLLFGIPQALHSPSLALISIAIILISIPVFGHLLVNLTLLLYNIFPPMQFYREVWKMVDENARFMPLWKVEAELAIHTLWQADQQKIEKNNRIEAWISNRFSIILVNMTIIITTIIILIVANFLLLTHPLAWQPTRFAHLTTWYLISCLIVIVLIINSYLLSKQTKHVAIKFCNDLFSEGD